MKKIWSVMLAVYMLLSSVGVVSADNVAQPEIIITKTNNSILIKVNVPLNVSGGMTAMILNNGATEDNVKLYGIGTDREPTEVHNSITDTLEGYQYEFVLNMHPDAPTGVYRVFIGNNIEKIGSQSFQHARVGDIVDFCTGLVSKNADEIYAYIYPDNMNEDDVYVHPKSPVDVTIYKELSGTVLTMVNTKIDGLDETINEVLNNVSGEYETVEEKAAKLNEIFVVPFENWMNIAKLATVEDVDEWVAIANDLLGAGDATDKFDDYFYKEETAGEAALDVADVFDTFKAECASMQELDFTEYQKAFDRATLMFIEDTLSSGMLGNAFEYFANKGAITPGTDTKKLIADDYDSQLWRDLKAMEHENCNALVSNTETLVSENDYSVKKENEDSQGTSSPSINKPTNPGRGGGISGGGGRVNTTTKPVVPPVETPEVTVVTFSDLDGFEWAEKAVEALAQKGVLIGRGNGIFAPNDAVTREELVKIIIEAFKLSDDKAKCDFADVDQSRWSYSYIATATHLGIVMGDGEAFHPSAEMTRQDMAVILNRLATQLKIDLNGKALSFDDEMEISDYAKEAVAALSGAGIINGMGDGTFAPVESVTRAQAAKVIYGLLNMVGGGK